MSFGYKPIINPETHLFEMTSMAKLYESLKVPVSQTDSSRISLPTFRILSVPSKRWFKCTAVHHIENLSFRSAYVPTEQETERAMM